MMNGFTNLSNKKAKYKKAIREGNHTAKQIVAYLKKQGIMQTPGHVRNFIYNNLKGEVRVERPPTYPKCSRVNKYHLD